MENADDGVVGDHSHECVGCGDSGPCDEESCEAYNPAWEYVCPECREDDGIDD